MLRSFSFEKLLLAFFIFIGLLIACRIYFSGSMLFSFLIWNIFLAWIPFKMSQYLLTTKGSKWKQGLLFAAWLLFFPNALYIITDLIHLELESSVPKWYDAILLFSSSVLGLMMAFISLNRVERFLGRMFVEKWKHLLVVLIIFFGSFGVYLGRFLRWNSWDIISNPVGLMETILHRVIFPWEHLRTWGMTGILTVFFVLVYESVKRIPSYIWRQDGSKPSDA